MGASYPRAPSGAAPLERTARYRRLVAWVLASVLAYGLAYLVLLAIAASALALLLTHPPSGQPTGLIAGWVVLTLVAFTAALFLVKGLVARPYRQRDRWIEITAARQPNFFGFLERLAGEVGAPMPKRVYLVPEVNAAMVLDSNLLSLLYPPRAELLMGMGLLNAVNVRELKALLAHELGHTSRHAMGLGNYAYLATAILRELVHGRDAVDELLRTTRIAAPAVLGTLAALSAGVVRIERRILGWLLVTVEIASLELLRAMELRADRVAIGSAGSPALIRLLAKASYADACLAHAQRELEHAGDHGMFSADLYVHQLEAVDTLPDRSMRPEWLRLDAPISPASPPLFADDDDARPSMWSTHPPSREREAAARAHWLEAPESPEDGEAAWTLFSEPEALRQRMTMSITRAAHPERAIRFAEPEAVSVLLADERLAQAASQRDLGAYDQRRFARLAIERIFIPRPALHRETLAKAHAELYGAEHQARAARVTERRETSKTLASAVGHAAREGEETFMFGGFMRQRAEAKALAQAIEAEIENDATWRKAWDARVAEVHAGMAQLLGDGSFALLRHRYAFHDRLEGLFDSLHAARHSLGYAMALASAPGRLDVFEIVLAGRATLDLLRELRDEARVETMPPLPNLPPHAATGAEGPLARILFPEPPLNPARFDEDDPRPVLDALGRIIAGALDRTARLRQKSIAALLEEQDRIAARFFAQG